MTGPIEATILVVDDNEAGRYITKRTLIQAGFKVIEAANATEALELVKEKPDLVILDVHLPDKLGFEVCQLIKAAPDAPPVLMLSATYKNDLARVRGIESGADGYLTQPVESVVLIAYVKALLRARRAEIKLRLAARQWQTTFDAISDGVGLTDSEGRFTRCNQAVSKILGKQLSEIIGHTCWELIHGVSEAPEGCPFKLARQTLKRESYQPLLGERWLEISIDPLLDETGHFIGGIYIASDITERRRAEEQIAKYQSHLEELVKERTLELTTTNKQLQQEIAERRQTENLLRESEEKYATLVEQARDGVAIIQDGVHRFINNAKAKMLGYTVEELIGRSFLDVVATEFKEQVAKKYQSFLAGEKPPPFFEIKFLAKDGSLKDIELSATLIQYQGKTAIMQIARDITERRKLKEELQKVQKLESIGVLAGGIAHDFNNILVPILASLSFVKMYVEPESKFFNYLSRGEEAAFRARELTQRLLTFARGGAPRRKAASIGRVLQDTVDLALSGSSVKCKFRLPEDLWTVDIDEVQIGQAIGNVIINALQAMPEGGGVIKVWAENVMVTTQNAVPLKEGKYIKIAVKDQGTGILPEYLQRIFEPYFTTKAEGSGLGLSIAYSIVSRHNGYIMAESELGAGATFYIYLPASEKKIVEVAEKKEKVEETLYKGHGKILFMDDEPGVRDMAAEMLSYLGYGVDLASNGAEAIDMYKKARESGQPFRAVILDLTIQGGMGGKEAIRKLREIDPQIKAIVSSGYSNDPIMAEYKRYGFSGVIPKPYQLKELDKILHSILQK